MNSVFVRKFKVGDREFVYSIFIGNFVLADNIKDGDSASNIKRIVELTIKHLKKNGNNVKKKVQDSEGV